MLQIYVGFDPREAAVYHTFVQSVIEHASQPVAFIPLHQDYLGIDGQQDGTNAFIYSRYLVPYLNGFKGTALFCDGDMIVKDDISKLFALNDESKAVMVVKHDYECTPRKYIGTPLESDNIAYPRKNWSSVMLFNCEHRGNAILEPSLVSSVGGAFLHRFEWLTDDEIGGLPMEWNWLEGEYPDVGDVKLVHHTLGSPGFNHYSRSHSAWQWNTHLINAVRMEGEDPQEMIRRAKWRHHGNALEPTA